MEKSVFGMMLFLTGAVGFLAIILVVPVLGLLYEHYALPLTVFILPWLSGFIICTYESYGKK